MKRQKITKERSDNHETQPAPIQCYICGLKTPDYRMVKYRGKIHYLCLGCAMTHTVS